MRVCLSKAGSPELLLLLPFISPVKLQKLVLGASSEAVPTSLRLQLGLWAFGAGGKSCCPRAKLSSCSVRHVPTFRK